MSEVTEAILLKSLKNKPEKCYFLYGKSVSDIETIVRAIIKRGVPSDDDLFALHSFEDRGFDINNFSNACASLPVFTDYVCVTVRDLNIEKLSAADIKALVNTIENLSDTNVVVFYYTGFDVTDGKKGPTPKAKKIADAVAKIGSVLVCNPKTPAALSKDIEKYIHSLGAKITPEAAVYLAETVGCDSLSARNECEKLSAYTDDINLETVDRLTPKLLDANIYDLARAVVEKNKNHAVQILKNLCYMRVEPVAILYALTGNILDLYRAKTALIAARSSQDMKNDFSYQRNLSFRVDNAFRDSRRVSLPFLRNAVRVLSETDLNIKSTAMDNVILLETALVRIMK
jgi:DNA polymerase-3 subunit delta